MNKEDPYRDQAEKLRKKIEKSTFAEGQRVEREDLPPRSAVHQKGRKRKTKLKVKYPLIRLLALFFILLPITVISIYSTIAKDKISGIKETISESTEEFETIEIEDKENQITEDEEAVPEKNPEVQSEDSSENTQSSIDKGSDLSAADRHTAAAPLTVHEKDIIYHKVKRGETIYKISMKYYKSKAGIDMIKAANNLTSNEILAGQVLTIPLNK
ncbi:LysM peptidoglycan-binding domain-containing protein [Bacillus benzoevorans]|uniref:LysM repeat protein n=1 Tax=Bacillus benzoevorans TaxID=1456 RepID=A0A7X0LUN5_9BACI|nr:LysM peptidoglycan-binding domain-containing protein [Bacillus benzoevorans]MBB6444733.1 LysM repeat protein [Bacillus benzoevorans]